MKTMSIWVASATMFLASMGICSCSMGSTTSSEMRGSLEFTQDDLREKPFKAIDVDVVASVYYTQNDGDECSVRLDYSAIKDAEFVQKLKEKIKVVYRDGEVKIGLTGRLKVPAMCNSEKYRLKIYITSPDLVKITQEGVGAFYAKSINSDRLEIDNEGVGSVKITNVSMGSLKVDNEGVGSVNLGFFKGGSLNILNEGVGSVKAKVDCQSVHATSEGVGGINLSGVTRQYSKKKDGIGGISDNGLTVRK